MTLHRYRPLVVPVVVIVAFAGLLLAQNAPQTQAQPAPGNQAQPGADTAAPSASAAAPPKMLVVNGKEMPSALAEVDGRYYVSVDSVAQITNGSLTIEPNRIVLVTPSEAAAPAAAPTEPGAAPAPEGMTRDFARQALSTLAYMREWKAAVATLVTMGVPVAGTWPDDYRDIVQMGVAQSQVDALSNEDRDALGLLENEAANLTSWSGQVVSARESMNAEQNINPNTLANDLSYQKITRCAEFLNAMLGSGVYADDPSCH